MQRPALAPCSRKRGQKAPNWNQRTISSYVITAHKDLHHHIIYSFLQNLEKWVFGVAAGVATNVSGPKSHSTHHHPLKSSHLRSKLYFFAAKNVLFSTWMASSAKVEGMSPDQSPAAYLHREHPSDSYV